MSSKLEEKIKEFNKKYKSNLVSVGVPTYDYKRIPFTSPRLNYMTHGGLPIGKLIEFYGEEHGGKTTTALDVVANYQQMEDAKKALWVDCEHTLDAVWATKLGVNLDDLIILQPENQSAEEIFQFVLDMISIGEIGLVVIDSFGVMLSAQALDKDMTEKTYAGISKALTDFGGRAVGMCNKYECTVIGINQMRDDLKSSFGGLKTVGGRAWKHDVSVRLEFSLGKYLDEKGNELSKYAESPRGNYVMVYMPKNKSCTPTRRTGFYTINYDYGIDYLRDLVDLAIKYGIIAQSGAWFDIIDVNTGEKLTDSMQGKAKVYAFLDDEANINILQNIEENVNRLMEEE